MTDIEPLEANAWLMALRRLSERSLNGEHIERSLRHGLHLVQLAPRPLRHLIHCGRSEEDFERLLDVGAFESAALALLGQQMEYAVARSIKGGVTAKVSIPGNGGTAESSSSSADGAILAAWLQCILSLNTRTQMRSGSVVPLSRLRQPQIEHGGEPTHCDNVG